MVNGQQFRSQGPDVLEELQSTADHLLRKVGLEPDQAGAVAQDLAETLRKHWGGQLVYFPSGYRLKLSETHRQIFEDWKANLNVNAIAKKHGVSIQTAYSVIRTCRSARQSQADPD